MGVVMVIGFVMVMLGCESASTGIVSLLGVILLIVINWDKANDMQRTKETQATYLAATGFDGIFSES